jgi:hypothetical protein
VDSLQERRKALAVEATVISPRVLVIQVQSSIIKIWSILLQPGSMH